MFTRPGKIREHTLMWMMTGLDGKELATASVTSLHAGWPKRWQSLSAGEEDTHFNCVTLLSTIQIYGWDPGRVSPPKKSEEI